MRRNIITFLLLGSVAAADAAEWRNTADSTFTFTATFEGDALPGEFRRFEVLLDFEPDAPESGSLTVTVELAAADFGDPDMNDVLHDPAWLDVAGSSEARFRSETITATQEGDYLAIGTLDLKGVQRTVSVPFSWAQDDHGARMRGDFSLRRTDFGVGIGEWAEDDSVGLDVALRFDVTLVADD